MKVFIAIVCFALVAGAYSQENDAVEPSVIGRILQAKANFTRRVAHRADQFVHNVKKMMPFRGWYNTESNKNRNNDVQTQQPNTYVRSTGSFDFGVPTPIPRPYYPRFPYVPNSINGRGTVSVVQPSTNTVDCTEKSTIEAELRISSDNKAKYEGDIARIQNNFQPDSILSTDDQAKIFHLGVEVHSAQANMLRLQNELQLYALC